MYRWNTSAAPWRSAPLQQHDPSLRSNKSVSAGRTSCCVGVLYHEARSSAAGDPQRAGRVHDLCAERLSCGTTRRRRSPRLAERWRVPPQLRSRGTLRCSTPTWRAPAQLVASISSSDALAPFGITAGAAQSRQFRRAQLRHRFEVRARRRATNLKAASELVGRALRTSTGREIVPVLGLRATHRLDRRAPSSI